jgi:hypothetical protein
MELNKEDINNECAHNLKSKDSCIDSNIIKNLSVLVNKGNGIITEDKDIISNLKKVYECSTDSCLLENRDVINILGQNVVNNQLDNNFKPDGPLDKNEWLSNSDIDSVLSQINKKDGNNIFKHINFQMRDFEKTGSELASIDFANEYKNNGIKCFGVVFNDDVSTGNGTHWTAMFGDFRKKPFTIEHFNSSGAGPQNEMRIWMKKTKMKLEKELNVTVNVIEVSKIQHQMDNSSCGPYSLYYIISRLEGVSSDAFQKNRIPDNKMWEFRKILFRKNE